MFKNFKKKIGSCFNILFFVTPLALYPKTSEIFEFNKMVFIYAFTVLITALWILRSIINGKIIFRRTPLDIPLLIFLFSQILSTFFSIDPYTSFFGYYSRFHGGLLSTICYLTLYWAYVSNLGRENALKSTKALFLSAILVSVWGIFEHFGHSFSCLIFPEFNTFDTNCWVQDVKNRVFASFGQPNWLAAWLAALIPITWAYTISSKLKTKSFKFGVPIPISAVYITLSLLFFITLLFTKSRSGILAFAVSYLIFWSLYFFNSNQILKFLNTKLPNYQTFLLPFIYTSIFLVIVVALIGTPWTPSVGNLLLNQSPANSPQSPQGPALETGGGTESGKIRQIVWRGALDIWKNYPVFGSGVETFAYSYYKFRPKEHNNVSEWDYLYNKAHNEYLNFAATTGTVGVISYLVLIIFSVIRISKLQLPNNKQITINNKQKNNLEPENRNLFVDWNLKIGILSGYASILITNFFGFSVAAVSLLFFLFPAIAISLSEKRGVEVQDDKKLNNAQIILICLLLPFTLYLLTSVIRYWQTDYLYQRAKEELLEQNYDEARNLYLEVTKRYPKNALYWDELAETTANIAVLQLENNNEKLGVDLGNSALNETKIALNLSPSNINLKRNASARYIQLAQIDQSLLTASINILMEAQKEAPTDPKIFYNLSLSYLRTGNYEKAIEYMEKAIDLKPDYERARYSVGLMYIDMKNNDKAKEHLNYILEKINPNNEVVKKELQDLK